MKKLGYILAGAAFCFIWMYVFMITIKTFVNV